MVEEVPKIEVDEVTLNYCLIQKNFINVIKFDK